jgi:hypothetical protein
VVYFLLTFTHNFELRDEGFLLRFGSRVAAGEIPHRDFVAVYGPGVHIVNGVAVWLFDGKIAPILLMLVVIKGGAVVLTFLISRFLVTRPFAAFGALLAAAYWGRHGWNLNTPYASLYTIPLCMLALLLLLRALHRRSTLGYVSAGLVAGAAILFKQSLGVFCAYGMALAVYALSALEDASPEKAPSQTRLVLLPWVVAAVAIVAPFLGTMRPQDYLLHFLPLHLLMLLAAAALIARGGCGSLTSILKLRLLPFAAGVSILPGITATIYAWWGALDELIFNMFIFPTAIPNYYLPVMLPPLSLSIFLAGVVALISSGLLLVGGRRLPALILGATAIATMCIARYLIPVGPLQSLEIAGLETNPDLYSAAILWQAAGFLPGIESTAISIAALAIFARSFLDPREARHKETLRSIIPLILFHTMVSFQIFPRASYNQWLLQGALMPLFAVVLFRWYKAGIPTGSTMARKVGAAALTALLPLWLVVPVLDRVVFPGELLVPRRALDLPRTEGIEVGPFLANLLQIDHFEKLVSFLNTLSPREAPLFLVTNEEMILFLTGREPLFPDREFYLFLLGWEMLPDRQIDELDAQAMVERLRDTPTAIVIDPRDAFSARLREALPDVSRFIDEEFDLIKRIGHYEVLRRRQV